MTDRKAHSTHAGTVAGALEAAKNVATEIDPPSTVDLRDEDREAWTQIMHARSREEWTDADLMLAGQLARTLTDLGAEQLTLGREGYVTENARGDAIENPRSKVVDTLTRRVASLYRTLQLQPTVNGKTARDMARKREEERKAREARGQVLDERAQDDSLLA